MEHSSALTAYGDSSIGTPVSLVVAPGQTTPPPHKGPLPFTGFELVPTLALAAVLVAAGAVLSRMARRPVAVRSTGPPDAPTDR